MTPETTTSEPQEPRKPVGNLTDFIKRDENETPLDIDIVVQNDAKVVIFHNREFIKPISWYEFDLTTLNLLFVMEDGESRDAGVQMTPQIAKNMQNSHQILTILMDDESGEAEEGQFVPLIIHRG